ncbi:MAG: RQC domain-containing protein [Methanobacterium sp.]
MPYMICKKCDIYYELADENGEKDLKICQCGSRMKYYEKLEDYLNSMECNINGTPLNNMDRLTMDYESAISRIVLQCLSEIPIDLGIKRFMLVLKGNKSPFILKYELNKLETYAMLSNFSEEHLRIIIDSITDNGFIKSEYISQYDGSNLKITEKGRVFLNIENNSQIGFMKKII